VKLERPYFALVLVKSSCDKQRRNSAVSDEDIKPWSGQCSKVSVSGIASETGGKSSGVTSVNTHNT